MIYYPQLEMTADMRFRVKDLKMAMVQKYSQLKDGKFVRLYPAKEKLTCVMEIPILGEESVYLDVLSGELLECEDYMTVVHPCTKYTEGSIKLLLDPLEMDKKLVDQSGVASYVQLFEYQKIMKRNELPKSTSDYYEGINTSGSHRKVLRMSEENALQILVEQGKHTILINGTEVSTLVGDEITRLRDTTKNEHVRTSIALYGETPNKEKLILYPALFGYFYAQIIEGKLVLKLCRKSKLKNITPFLERYPGAEDTILSIEEMQSYLDSECEFEDAKVYGKGVIIK